MYTICRLILIATVAATAVFLAVLTARFGNVVLILLAIAGASQVLRRRRRAKLDAFGTARWSGVRDVRRAGLTAGHGLIVGTLCGSGRPSQLAATLGLINPLIPSAEASDDFLRAIFPRIRGNLPLVRLSRAVHLAVFAPSGVGKNVSCVNPFLLDCPESCVDIDFKGESARATMAARRRMGNRIVSLDPYHMVTNEPDCLNPLDFIMSDTPHMIDEIRDLAESLVVRTGQEREPHWNDSAEAWIAAAIAVVVQYGDPDDRSLQTVRSLLASSPEKLNMMIKLLCESDACDGMLSRMGYQLTQFKDKELSSTLTTANRFLRFLDTPAIAASTSRSTFDPNRLTREKTTVYLGLPPEHARAQSPLLRMWISTLFRGVLRGGLQERNRVHFVLDEAAALGHLDCLDDAVDKYRGYGVRLIFMYQSLGQLKKCFPEGQDQTLLSNVTQVFFGVNDQPTAEYVSNRLGDETIIVESGGSSRGGSRQYSYNSPADNYSHSWNTTSNWGQQGRKLLKSDEVMALSPRIAITFAPGLPPICTQLTRYYEGRPDSWGRRLMQGVRANVYAAATLAAVVIGTEAVRDIDNQPKLPQPRVVPGVPDRRLPQRGERNAIRRENQANAWQRRE